MGALKPIEDKMEEYLYKKAPFQIPEEGRKGLVKILPWLALIFGAVSLISAYQLWELSRRVNEVVNVVNQFVATTGIGSKIEYGFIYHLALIVLVVSGLLMLASFNPLKNFRKNGWDLALWGVIVNLAYGVIVAFSDVAGSSGRLIGAIVSALVGAYLLAQIRDYYIGKKKIPDVTKTNKPTTDKEK